MEVPEAVEMLENSNVFKQWKKQNPESYLTYAFIMMEKNHETDWQLGYYKKNNDTITSFTLGAEISVSEDNEIIKQNNIIEQLDVKKIKFSLNEILKVCQELQCKKYPQDKPAKIIAILHVLHDFGQVWNITYLTERINTLNFKIKSDTKEIVHDELKALIEFKN
ncbi:hypothetical protein DRJ17_01595 [Candidatus Woesearchaeota archaeon]|nr:MAG: hypothetical protein DRJ17_01595 [Candidatus Woesearchaeota archaeon]